MELPLEERSKIRKDPLTNVEEELPELHPKWTSEISFLTYESPPQCRGDSSQAAVDEWLERAEFIREDVDWLLSQNHQLFWCQVIFDKSLHKLLDSFLASAPRPSDLIELSKPVASIQDALHQSLFLVFLRMATHKESSEDFFTPSVFGDILYQNYLFDIPKVVDLCALYGDEACFSAEESDEVSHVSQLLQRMVRNIFERQPAYADDLLVSVQSLTLALDNITQTLQGSASGMSRADTLLYCYDLTHSLSLFCHTHRPVSQVFMNSGFLDRVLAIAPMLKSALSFLSQDSSVPRQLSSALCQRLPVTCSRLLWELMFTSELAAPSGKALVSTLNSLSSNWPEALARLDDCAFGLEHQITNMHLLEPNDLRSVAEKVSRARKSYPALTPSPISTQEASDSACASAAGGAVTAACASASAGVHGAEYQQVLELFPDFDKDLVQLALQQTDGSVERAVNLLLEGKVSRPSPAVNSASSSQGVAGKAHSNSAAHGASSGKASHGSKYTKFVLEGQGHDDAVAAVRATLDALETKEFEETVAGLADEYNDEYDDTYDSYTQGDMPGAGGEDRDEFVIRRLNQKVPLFRQAETSSEGGSEDEDSANEGGEAKSEKEAGQHGRNERHRHAAGVTEGDGSQARRGGAGGGGRGRGGARGGRGRGVPPDTRRAYQHKEQHKSSRANHNRKSGADWKRRGMGGINAAPPPTR